MQKVMVTAAVIIGLATPMAAKPALRDVPVIDSGLFAVGLADQIRKICPSISARFFRALSFLRDLERKAEEMGYSVAEVEAHLDSDIEKDRLRARAAAYMAQQGFTQDETGYCALGRAEVERNSRIGTLLRVTE